MLKLKSFWHGGIFAVAASLVVSSIGLLYTQDPRNALADVNTLTCGPLVQFVYINPGEIVSGDNFELEFYSPPVTGGLPFDVEEIDFYIGESYIGSPQEEAGNWFYEWDTTLFPNGSGVLTAQVFDDDDYACTTLPMPIEIQNTETANPNGSLRIRRHQPQHDDWFGVTNTLRTFKVRTTVGDGTNTTFVTNDAKYTWRLENNTDVGTLQQPLNKSSAQYFTGPIEGNATIIVEAEFAGQFASTSFDVFAESDDNLDYDEPTEEEINEIIDSIGFDDDFEDGLDEDASNETDTSTGSRDPLTSDPAMVRCMVSVIGIDSYRQVASGQNRLTFAELAQAERCFASTRFIVPSYVAPVEPDEVRNLVTDADTIRVESVEQAANQNNNAPEDDSIVLRGVSLPNTTIVLYIFSEPLVLTTTTDGEGNWTYVLEDPLAPGEHEVYVAVERSNGDIVRSEVSTFTVSASPANIQANPAGLSLTLDLSEADDDSTIYYVSSVAAVLLIGLGLYIFIVRRKTASLDGGVDSSESKVKKSDIG